MIVVDASVAVEIVLQLGAADALMDRLFAKQVPLYAPELLDVEVAQVIRRYWLNGDISAARGGEAITDLADLPITRMQHGPLLPRVWQLRSNATAYDATYLALAEALDAVLITRDEALRQVPRTRATVEVL